MTSQQSNQEITVQLFKIGDEPETAKVFSCPGLSAAVAKS